MFEGELRASLTLRDAKGSAWQPYVCQRGESRSFFFSESLA